MRFDVAVSGALILSAANGYAPFYGSVGVKDSRIAWVTEKTIAPSECDTWVDGTDRILMPGLVNAHCHGDMTLARGLAMGLEFKLGSEILRTVVVRDWKEIGTVAGIIALRAALTFLIHWEIKEEEKEMH